nr:hypothetical protein [uncultured Faecalimonas sp.]
MTNSIGMSSSSYYAPMASQSFPVADSKGQEELTTVTTHCNKNHKHTPECPHTTFIRPATAAEGKGRYLDLYA